MKKLEINSDRYTTVTVAILLVFTFWSLITNARHLLYLTYRPEPRTWPNYLMSVFFCYVLLASGRERKLLREYPYGAAGFTFFLVDFVLKMALQKDVSVTVAMISGFMGATAALLLILEIALWFRTKVKLVSGDGKDAVVSSR